MSDIEVTTIRIPKSKWSMTIGNFTIYHTTEYSVWQAFWLRSMGWKVEKCDE